MGAILTMKGSKTANCSGDFFGKKLLLCGHITWFRGISEKSNVCGSHMFTMQGSKWIKSQVFFYFAKYLHWIHMELVTGSTLSVYDIGPWGLWCPIWTTQSNQICPVHILHISLAGLNYLPCWSTYAGGVLSWVVFKRIYSLKYCPVQSGNVQPAEAIPFIHTVCQINVILPLHQCLGVRYQEFSVCWWAAMRDVFQAAVAMATLWHWSSRRTLWRLALPVKLVPRYVDPQLCAKQ